MKPNQVATSMIGILLLLSVVLPIAASNTCLPSMSAVEGNGFFYTYETLVELLTLLQTQYPQIFSYRSLTQTYQGRDVWLVKISDNVLENESEPQILFMGGVHGSEKPGFQTVIYSLRSLVENYTTPKLNDSFTLRIRSIVNTTELFFIPMVNPDGITASCRKNCRPNDCLFGKKKLRGVDINRNYDYNWEDVDRHPLRYIVIPRTWEQFKLLWSGDITTYLFERTAIRYPFLDVGSFINLGFYRGPEAFSEPESAAVKDFIEKHHVTISVDYHTYGEKIIYPQPWRYTDPDDNSTFVSLAENVSKINGYRFDRRINWSNLSGNYLYWAYATQGIFPLTIELCNSSKQNREPDEPYLMKVFHIHLLVNLYLAERLQAE